VELVEEREGQDASDTGNGLEALEGVGILDLGLVGDGALEGADDFIEVSGQDEVGLYAGPYHGVRDQLSDTDAVTRVVERGRGCGQVELMKGRANVCEELAPFADEEQPTSK
jgi:hypothetical protein